MFKPPMKGILVLQDDHYRRLADLCFRHLQGTFNHFTVRRQHEWIRSISNSDPKYGTAPYLDALMKRDLSQSEEYSHAIASVLFAHIWLLSAANYYRLSCKYKTPHDAPWLSIKPIEKTSSPALIAKELNLDAIVIQQAEILHDMRNTIAHLNETHPTTAPMKDLDFPTAFRLVESVWTIYIALLHHYGVQADTDSWVIQTNRYGLPAKAP
ncbi:MAG TPA: hypothetical protein VK302_16315 [Terriglobales bacterium]|nr:hypothetical protein [Terriglobales bacterium]